MKKQIFKIFIRINLFSVLTTLILTLVLVFICKNPGTNREEMRNCYMPYFAEILASASAFFISLSTVSIFLNLFLKIRQTKMNVALSFLFLPILSTLYLWLSLFKSEMKDNETLIMAVYFPVWFFIIREFLKFSKTTIKAKF